MLNIINKTKEFYPTLEGAEYLLYLDPSLPKNLEITKSNVRVNGLGELSISVFGDNCNWGWSFNNSFCRNFATPEEAIADFLKFSNLY